MVNCLNETVSAQREKRKEEGGRKKVEERGENRKGVAEDEIGKETGGNPIEEEVALHSK